MLGHQRKDMFRLVSERGLRFYNPRLPSYKRPLFLINPNFKMDSIPANKKLNLINGSLATEKKQ